MKLILTLIALASLTGCAAPRPMTPQEQEANRQLFEAGLRLLAPPQQQRRMIHSDCRVYGNSVQCTSF